MLDKSPVKIDLNEGYSNGYIIWKNNKKVIDLPIALLTLEEWTQIIDLNNEYLGWNEEKTEAEWAILAVSEIAEAFEEYRNDKDLIYTGENGKPEGLAIEYADCMIRILHWFARHKVNPGLAMAIKMQYNTTRPYRHGNKKA